MLIEMGAVPNVMTAILRSEQHLQPNSAFKKMRIADRAEATVSGEVDKIPPTLGAMTHSITVLVVNDAPLSLIIEMPAMKI